MAIQHELSWSTSRAGTLAECPRRYYFDYYLSWGGWAATAAPERRRAYLLKKMTRMPMLAGDLVHRAIARYYEARDSGVQESCAAAVAWAVGQLREGYKTSRDGRWKMRPSKLTRLAEHHYEEPRIDEGSGDAAEYGKRYVERITRALEAFHGDPDLAEARAVEPADTLACEELSTFDFEGTKVYAVPDFAYRRADGTVVVYDWKTGKPSAKDRFQLAVYVEYAVNRWGVDADDVLCRNAYLGSGDGGEHVEHRYSEPERAEIRSRMRSSIEAMRTLHFDADRSAGDPSAFPALPAESPEARACTTCNYRELCDRA